MDEEAWQEHLRLQALDQHRQEIQDHPQDRDRHCQHARQSGLRHRLRYTEHEPGRVCRPGLPVRGAPSLAQGERLSQPDPAQGQAEQAVIRMPAAAQSPDRQDSCPCRARLRRYHADGRQDNPHNR